MKTLPNLLARSGRLTQQGCSLGGQPQHGQQKTGIRTAMEWLSPSRRPGVPVPGCGVEERAKKASPKWRADCLSRRLCILEREPVAVTLNGQRALRSNPQSHLLRNSRERPGKLFSEITK